MDKNELKLQLAAEIEHLRAALDAADCLEDTCDAVKKSLWSPKEGAGRCAWQLKQAGALDKECEGWLVDAFWLLANKYYRLGNPEDALFIISNCKKKLALQDAAFIEKLDKLAVEIKSPVQSALLNEPVEEKFYKEVKEKNNSMAFVAVALVVIVALGVLLIPRNGALRRIIGHKHSASFSSMLAQSVNISFDVPDGTAVLIDGNKTASGQNIKIKVGKHNLQLEHPLLDFVYDQRINISNAGKLALYKEIKAGAALKSAVTAAGTEMMNDILKQACSSGQLQLTPGLYAGDADSNGMLTKAFVAMHSYAQRQGISSMAVEKFEIEELELVNSDNGKELLAKAAATVVGSDEKGRRVNYTILVLTEIKGDHVLVNKLGAFKATLVK